MQRCKFNPDPQALEDAKSDIDNPQRINIILARQKALDKAQALTLILIHMCVPESVTTRLRLELG